MSKAEELAVFALLFLIYAEVTDSALRSAVAIGAGAVYGVGALWWGLGLRNAWRRRMK